MFSRRRRTILLIHTLPPSLLPSSLSLPPLCYRRTLSSCHQRFTGKMPRISGLSFMTVTPTYSSPCFLSPFAISSLSPVPLSIFRFIKRDHQSSRASFPQRCLSLSELAQHTLHADLPTTTPTTHQWAFLYKCVCVWVCVCMGVCKHCRFTRAYSIFSVQQPAYMSAPFRADLALWAFWTDSNVREGQSRNRRTEG